MMLYKYFLPSCLITPLLLFSVCLELFLSFFFALTKLTKPCVTFLLPVYMMKNATLGLNQRPA